MSTSLAGDFSLWYVRYDAGVFVGTHSTVFSTFENPTFGTSEAVEAYVGIAACLSADLSNVKHESRRW